MNKKIRFTQKVKFKLKALWLALTTGSIRHIASRYRYHYLNLVDPLQSGKQPVYIRNPFLPRKRCKVIHEIGERSIIRRGSIMTRLKELGLAR